VGKGLNPEATVIMRWLIGLSRKLQYLIIFFAVIMAIMLFDVTPLDHGRPVAIDPHGQITLTQRIVERLDLLLRWTPSVGQEEG
jgi:hypothetical protein